MQDTSTPARKRRPTKPAKPSPVRAGAESRRRRTALRQIPIGFVARCPLNPRTTFPEQALAELAASIRQDGILQPLLLRPTKATAGLTGERFEIVAGERRWRAAQQAGLTEVPAIVREMDDLRVMRAMIVENVQRNALTPLEECAGYKALLAADSTLTPESVAEMVGRSRSWVYSRLQMAKLTKPAAAALGGGEITAGHAVELARLRPGDQNRMLAAARNVSVSGLQAEIARTVMIPAPEGVVPVVDSWNTHRPAGSGVLATDAYVVVGDSLDSDAHDGPQSSVEQCKHAVDALVVLGRRRGTRVRICPRRSRCETHWKEHVERLAQIRERDRRWKREAEENDRRREAENKRLRQWHDVELPEIRRAVLSGTWDVEAMIRVVLDALRNAHRGQLPSGLSGLEPLHAAAFLAVTGTSWNRDSVVARARALGVKLDRRGRLVEPRRGGPAPKKAVQPSARAAAGDGSGGGI